MTQAEVAVVAARLDDLDEKLDAIHHSLAKDIDEVKQLAQATNGRVRQLELWRAKAEGALAAAGLAKPVVYSAAGIAVGLVAERLLGG